MAHDVATTILELATKQHQQEAQQREQEAQRRQAEDIAGHRYQLRIGCSAVTSGGDLWRDDNVVSLRFSSHDGGVVCWLPIGAQLVSSTSREAALSLIPRMMIQEFHRVHGQMEGSMLETNLLWVGLAAGQRRSPHSAAHWEFPPGNVVCKQFVLISRDAPAAERISVPSLMEILETVLALGLEARVVRADVGGGWNSDSDIEWSDDGVQDPGQCWTVEPWRHCLPAAHEAPPTCSELTSAGGGSQGCGR